MANQQRLRRVADQIQRELSGLLHAELQGSPRRDDHPDRSRVSPDLAHAKVFFTTLGDAEALGPEAKPG